MVAVTAEDSHSAFRDTISLYQEKVQGSGLIGCMDYATSGNQGGKATNTGRSCFISASDSDFICDIEVAARRTLAEAEMLYFKKYYVSGQVVVLTDADVRDEGKDEFLEGHINKFPEPWRPVVAVIDRVIREKVGRVLIQSALHKYHNYGHGRDGYGRQRDNKTLRRKRDRWSHLY